jgi:hypothetical protein
MTGIASKDSKQQLIQAFGQIFAERKTIDSKIATKQEEAEKEKSKEILAAASEYTVDSIVKAIADLQLEFGSIVSGLSEKLAGENSKLEQLNKAIEIESQNLKELQQIRVVADTLDILRKEHQEKLKVLEQDTASKRELLEKEISQTRKGWQKEQADFEEAEQIYNESLIKERTKEEEEYLYKLETTLKLNTNAYEAKKRMIEREVQETTQDKEKNWAEREKFLNANQKLFTEYQQKVAAFPNELAEAIKKAREEAIKDATQKATVEANLFEKEWQGSKQSYELRIEALEQTIQKQSEQIESITAQLQAALKQAQDLAMRAFNK